MAHVRTVQCVLKNVPVTANQWVVGAIPCPIAKPNVAAMAGANSVIPVQILAIVVQTKTKRSVVPVLIHGNVPVNGART